MGFAPFGIVLGDGMKVYLRSHHWFSQIAPSGSWYLCQLPNCAFRRFKKFFQSERNRNKAASRAKAIGAIQFSELALLPQLFSYLACRCSYLNKEFPQLSYIKVSQCNNSPSHRILQWCLFCNGACFVLLCFVLFCSLLFCRYGRNLQSAYIVNDKEL
eukprot:SAG31_NODE_12024_length_976_cov_1.386545_1_plen_158_part_00